ncbi:hypothetical protein N7510_006829 [Penicillium lagena]|uniref:uncharacterized protein n=1 Tax=Penicillium lagena TaxID=94218 RepID=UPI00253FE412|nr:uncharacterized protein N7510_006829 [Penicillium lagena]KAJ5610110.1 hypothetical protein N7510_006829 [Penicillium lagena]
MSDWDFDKPIKFTVHPESPFPQPQTPDGIDVRASNPKRKGFVPFSKNIACRVGATATSAVQGEKGIIVAWDDDIVRGDQLFEQLIKSHAQSISEGFQDKADVTLADDVAAIDIEQIISVGSFANNTRDEVLGNRGGGRSHVADKLHPAWRLGPRGAQ